jgi:hypothetical protein
MNEMSSQEEFREVKYDMVKCAQLVTETNQGPSWIVYK